MGLSINAIARLLNDRQSPTRTATTRWERSTIWGMLRNPAYCGKACYGKTELRPRQRITRPLRQPAAVDQARYLQLAETLATFRGKLRARAETLDVVGRQQIVRLLVKEILVGSDTITIRHSLPVPPSGSGSSGMSSPSSGMLRMQSQSGYLLRSGSHRSALRRPFVHRIHQPAFHHSGSQKCADQLQQPLVADPLCDLRYQFVVIDSIEEFF